MPILGDIKKGEVLGYKNRFGLHIWQACKNCGAERWVLLRNKKPVSQGCVHCNPQNNGALAGERNGNWQGGRRHSKVGYVRLYAKDKPRFLCMADSTGYVAEHRLVMAEHLGRVLLPEEHVHHINGIKDDNRIENLCLTDNHNHDRLSFLHKIQERIRELEERVRKLEQAEGV